MNDYLTISKQAWIRASGFPIDKERVYPDHTKAQEFDSYTDKYVLEYGCGGGSDTLSYLKRGNTVAACDIVPENIETAKKNVKLYGYEDEVTFHLLEDSVPLPFEDNIFDVVSSHGVVHHIINASEVVKEFYRVCKFGGYCYMMLYTENLYKLHEDTIKQLMVTYNIKEAEAFCWCTDGQGTPYACPYEVQDAIALGHRFKYISHLEWLSGCFRTYKFRKE